MGKILDSFVSTLAGSQAQSIREVLKKKIASGQIETPEGYREAFESSARGLIGAGSQRLFSGYSVKHGDRISSAELNDSFDEIALDIEMLFGEMDFLLLEGEAQRARNKEEIETRLESAISELEAEIDRVSFLHKNLTGVHKGIVENFKAGGNRLERSAEEASNVYIDPKTLLPIEPELEMIPAPANGGLVLPVYRDLAISGSIVDQEQQDISSGEREALPVHGKPSTVSNRLEDILTDIAGPPSLRRPPAGMSSMTDGQIGTFWTKSVYRTSQSNTTEAYLNLRLDLGGSKLFDYIQIEPAGVEDQELSAVYITDEEMVSSQIAFSPFEVKGPVRLFLKKKKAKEITLLFTQRNATGQPTRLFRFGFDNIFAGESSYREKGFYASRTIKGHNLSSFRLFAEENGTSGGLNAVDLGQHDSTTDSTLIAAQLPPVEYYLAYRDLDNAGNVVFNRKLPILKAGQTRVREKLVLRGNGTALLNFHVRPASTLAADGSYSDVETLRIYRNGILLKRGAPGIPGDYIVRNRFLDNDVFFERKTDIEFIGTSTEDAEFIADYSPYCVSALDQNYADESGLIKYRKDGSIEIERPGGSRATRSEVNLLIIVRNTGDNGATSVINSYKLGFGEKNED